jgi:hypothetical protein
MTFKRLHHGYFISTSEATGDEYVIRTRPKNDGWMAINETEGIVIATGLTFVGAMNNVKSYDKLVDEAIAKSNEPVVRVDTLLTDLVLF